ncbi:MAG: hypothetical protein KDA75_12635 [Planctomycetaceae bacterium]|nr:hypothetical protein [Planctomycetaceae bacterium]
MLLTAMTSRLRFIALVLAAGTASIASAATKLASLPVREVTIFKDGHAFVLHEGEAERDADGNVRLGELPAAVIGTFWPFSTDPNRPLQGVAVGRERITLERTALSVQELLWANIGARVVIRESDERSFAATIVGIPRRTPEELSKTTVRTNGPALSQPGEIILLKTDDGVRAVGISTITDVTFVDPPRQTCEVEELRDVLTLRLPEGPGDGGPSRVGMTYLQKGLRWIPQYRVTLLENGRARVDLQATLLNELVDLDGVTTHLVIGVPTFEFEATLDPLAVNQTLDHLSAYFRKAHEAGVNVNTHFSNAIMLQSQVARMNEYRTQPTTGVAGDSVNPAVGAGDDDLFVFTLEDLTLRRGERMVVSVGSWEVTYEDLYRLKLPFSPPQELRRHFESQRQAELAQLQTQPKVMHVARLKNTSGVPFTTAPALLMEEGRILAQGMMTYTSAGSTVDLDITAAVNVPVAFEDSETGRVPDAVRWQNTNYQRINLEGRIALSNYHDRPIRVEVERMLVGSADEASDEADISRPGWHTDQQNWGAGYGSYWWSYSWPHWWHHLNSISRLRWTIEIPAGERKDLTYTWHYFWG